MSESTMSMPRSWLNSSRASTPVVGEFERILATANFAPHALQHELLEIGFVVDNEDLAGIRAG